MDHVITKIERPDKEIIKQFEGETPSTVYEAQGRIGAMRCDIKPLYSGMKICGPAITVQCHPGDNIMLHKAIAIAEAGDVIVASVNYSEAGYWGEVLTVAAQARGIEGLVTDGSVRDGLAIKKRKFPLFSKGLCMKGTVKETLGFINYSIVCGSVLVNPGDIILGDDDGIVVVHKERAQETLEKSRNREKKEQIMMEKLASRESTTLELLGLDEVLKSKGLQEKKY